MHLNILQVESNNKKLVFQTLMKADSYIYAPLFIKPTEPPFLSYPPKKKQKQKTEPKLEKDYVPCRLKTSEYSLISHNLYIIHTLFIKKNYILYISWKMQLILISLRCFVFVF